MDIVFQEASTMLIIACLVQFSLKTIHKSDYLAINPSWVAA